MTDFIHRFEPGAEPCLLLLHGTGGDENDLLPLGRVLAPGAALLSPRGKALENGMPRFFRRLAEGVFDLADLKLRTAELADWIVAARQRYGLARVIAAGYSNGANIAASTLMARPEALDGALLFRAMVGLTPETPPRLQAKPVFLSAGRDDPIVPAENTGRLARMLEDAGAEVKLHWEEAGHGLVSHEIAVAKEWLQTHRERLGATTPGSDR